MEPYVADLQPGLFGLSTKWDEPPRKRENDGAPWHCSMSMDRKHTSIGFSIAAEPNTSIV